MVYCNYPQKLRQTCPPIGPIGTYSAAPERQRLAMPARQVLFCERNVACNAAATAQPRPSAWPHLA